MAQRQNPSSEQSQGRARSVARSVLIWGSGVAAFVLLVGVIISGTLDEPAGGIPEGTETFQVTDGLHVDGVIYGDDEVPPGGRHSPIWANCGFYDQQIAAENAVHSLEHGAVWITYRPEVSASDLETIRALASPVEKVLASPVPGQNSPIMATAWGHQLSLETTDDPRLDQFVAQFAGSLDAPEPGGACTGGIGSPS